jgi:hypothetical protein
MDRRIAGLGAAALLLVVSACGDDEPPVGPVGAVGPQGDEQEHVAGSGDLVSEVREVAGFDRIVHAGLGNVVVTLGGDESLTIETDDNILPYIETSVEGGRLEIGVTPGFDIAPTQPVSYQVGATELAGLELSGVGNVRLGDWETEEATLSLTGVGDIDVDGLSAVSLEVALEGVGTITVSGDVEEQTVLAADVGRYDGAELRSRVASVEAREVAATTVWVTDELDITIADRGSVSYYGQPQVTREGTAGKVTDLGDK